jgi:glycosyltransferase involved in cell wall biosynthesis
MDSHNDSLSVFFPFYNEESNLERVIHQALDVLPSLCPDFEVIMVDDGSRDRTPHIMEALAQRSPRLKIVQHLHNKGYGAALSSGFAAATKEWVFFSDGDCQFDLRELALLWERRNTADAVIGYRIRRNDPFARKVNSWLWNRLVRLLLNIKVKDLNCAFKLFHREQVEALHMESNGMFVNAEILAKLSARNAKFEEVGVHHYPRLTGQATGANVTAILVTFKELFSLGLKLRS